MPTEQSESPMETAQKPKRPLLQAMLRGLGGRCPCCGKGRLFSRYLKVVDECAECGEALHHHRADDAPPYFTIFIAGHLIVPPLMIFERMITPPLWLHALIWLPLTLLLCLILLPLIKGTIVGLQWACYMHGFDPEGSDEITLPKAETVG